MRFVGPTVNQRLPILRFVEFTAIVEGSNKRGVIGCRNQPCRRKDDKYTTTKIHRQPASSLLTGVKPSGKTISSLKKYKHIYEIYISHSTILIRNLIMMHVAYINTSLINS